MKKLPTGSVVIGSLSQGCELCQRGMKLVLFITGLCSKKCFYCPLSQDRKYLDIVLANERRVKRLNEVLDEAYLMDARGTGITGGDPLLVLDRTIKAIQLLKSEFGGGHHIHLYTTGVKINIKSLKELEQVGLDEIRFHVYKENLKPVMLAVSESNMDVGVEIPMLPDKVKETIELLKSLDKIKVNFVNINELEFTESNALSLLERGYELRPDSLTAAKGSKEAALEILKWAEENTSLNIHFCPAIVKDAYQTRLRLYRRAINTAKHYELVTDEGTIVLATALAKDTRAVKDVIEALKNDGLFERDWKENKVLFRVDYIDSVLKKVRNDVEITIREYMPTPHRFLVYEEKLLE